MASESQCFRDDFEKFCSTEAASVTDDQEDVVVQDFATTEYENPVAWHRNGKLPRDSLTNDLLFERRKTIQFHLARYDRGRPLPEYTKWKLFSCYLIICFEYIFQRKPDMALDIIDDIENILESIGSDDPFLRSIRIALDHVTFSMKGHILKLCLLDTESVNFVMPNNMDSVNKAGLLGIQALVLDDSYGMLCTHMAKDIVQRAILLNETEAEWHFLMSRILLNWTTTSSLNYTYQELQSAKLAVQFNFNNKYKVNLVKVYFRSFLQKRDVDIGNHHLETGINLLNEILEDTTIDLVLLQSIISSLSYVTYSKKVKKINTVNILEKMIDKLESTNNDYLHGDIGIYYLMFKKDYEKALFHLKKAFDVNCFQGTINYILMFFKINSTNAPVEEMLTDMLNKFPHPVHQEKILSQIVSYKIITKNDIIGALKYIPMLLRLKDIACVYNLQFHKIIFDKAAKFMAKFSVVDVLYEKLNAALMRQTLSIDNKTSITEMLQLLKSYKEYSRSMLLKHKVYILNKDSNFHGKNNEPQEVRMPYNKLDRTCVKTVDEGNWRTLKPDSKPKSHIFSQGHHNNNI